MRLRVLAAALALCATTAFGQYPSKPVLARAAELAVKGEYFRTGEELEKRRRKDVGMNTEVRDLSHKQENDE